MCQKLWLMSTLLEEAYVLTSKIVTLSVSVRHLFKKAQLLSTSMNNFGICISYSPQELGTTIAQKVVERNTIFSQKINS